MSEGRFVVPSIVTPPCSTTSPGTVSSQFPPVSAARSTITEPARMRSTALAGISFGAGRPGTAAVVITTSKSGMRSSSAACCCACSSAESSLAYPPSVSSVRTPRSRNAAPRLSTCSLTGGPDVEGGDDGAEPSRRRDRLQARDARADHERTDRCDRPRGRHQHREELRDAVGGEENRLVAGDRGLRRERIHRLRARDSRDRLHGERDHAGLAQLRDPLRVGERLEEPDEDRPR